MQAEPAVNGATKALLVLQDMHLLAERLILSGLKEGGWLQGDVEDMLEQRIAALFMPHGVSQASACCHCASPSMGRSAIEIKALPACHVFHTPDG